MPRLIRLGHSDLTSVYPIPVNAKFPKWPEAISFLLFQIWDKRPLRLKDDLIRNWWSKVTMASHMSHSHERHLSGMPGGNFFKCGTNVSLILSFRGLSLHHVTSSLSVL